MPEAEGGGDGAVLVSYEGRRSEHPVFAPPILVDDDLVICQTAPSCEVCSSN